MVEIIRDSVKTKLTNQSTNTRSDTMKKQLVMLWIAGTVIGILATGCNRDTTGPQDEQAPVGVTNEEGAMKYYAANDEFVKNDEATFDDQAIETMDYGTFGKIDAEITPLRFGRFIRSITRNIALTILSGDSIAIAHVEKDITGVFKIKGVNGNGDTVIVEKPFNDKSKRNVVFKRIRKQSDRYWLNWLPVATSLVDGGTVLPDNNPPNNKIDLTKLQLFLPNGDTITVTDPTSYYLRYRWTYLFTDGPRDIPELIGGERLRLQATVVSTSPDTDIVALRYGVGTFFKRRMRMQLVSEVNNNGTYTRVFEAPFYVHFHRGFFHAGVDAITRATLYDDVAPYSVNWWGVPYRVF